jgi:hypothetical protein
LDASQIGKTGEQALPHSGYRQITHLPARDAARGGEQPFCQGWSISFNGKFRDEFADKSR